MMISSCVAVSARFVLVRKSWLWRHMQRLDLHQAANCPNRAKDWSMDLNVTKTGVKITSVEKRSAD